MVVVLSMMRTLKYLNVDECENISDEIDLDYINNIRKENGHPNRFRDPDDEILLDYINDIRKKLKILI